MKNEKSLYNFYKYKEGFKGLFSKSSALQAIENAQSDVFVYNHLSYPSPDATDFVTYKQYLENIVYSFLRNMHFFLETLLLIVLVPETTKYNPFGSNDIPIFSVFYNTYIKYDPTYEKAYIYKYRFNKNWASKLFLNLLNPLTLIDNILICLAYFFIYFRASIMNFFDNKPLVLKILVTPVTYICLLLSYIIQIPRIIINVLENSIGMLPYLIIYKPIEFMVKCRVHKLKYRNKIILDKIEDEYITVSDLRLAMLLYSAANNSISPSQILNRQILSDEQLIGVTNQQIKNMEVCYNNIIVVLPKDKNQLEFLSKLIKLARGIKIQIREFNYNKKIINNECVRAYMCKTTSDYKISANDFADKLKNKYFKANFVQKVATFKQIFPEHIDFKKNMQAFLNSTSSYKYAVILHYLSKEARNKLQQIFLNLKEDDDYYALDYNFRSHFEDFKNSKIESSYKYFHEKLEQYKKIMKKHPASSMANSLFYKLFFTFLYLKNEADSLIHVHYSCNDIKGFAKKMNLIHERIIITTMLSNDKNLQLARNKYNLLNDLYEFKELKLNVDEEFELIKERMRLINSNKSLMKFLLNDSNVDNYAMLKPLLEKTEKRYKAVYNTFYPFIWSTNQLAKTLKKDENCPSRPNIYKLPKPIKQIIFDYYIPSQQEIKKEIKKVSFKKW